MVVAELAVVMVVDVDLVVAELAVVMVVDVVVAELAVVMVVDVVVAELAVVMVVDVVVAELAVVVAVVVVNAVPRMQAIVNDNEANGRGSRTYLPFLRDDSKITLWLGSSFSPANQPTDCSVVIKPLARHLRWSSHSFYYRT
ncbi:hypothetical protein Pcinc_019409 [Petrolisthes cinctipes]|uniref:Uncharacterized protein n=1 Tax=Petrolisthes cinctipes TaxID=88211 RepID=A0AAE1KMS2_PETCI|nr:hypothetical protein Pcinc_019409 [Petrolisthes cinctipes]